MMSTTNDEQAPYGKQDQRAPMLSEEKIGQSGLTAKRIAELIKETGLNDDPLFTDREIVRRVVESLITKGVLRVVKKANNNGSPSVFYCSSCNFLVDGQNGIPVFNFCPGCGDEIVKP